MTHVYNVAAILAVTLSLNVWMIRTGLRRLIQPLEALSERSRLLADGADAEPVAVTGPEELARLSRAFNNMLARRRADTERIETTLNDLQTEKAKLSEANRSLGELTQCLREKHQEAVFERGRFLAMVERLHEGLIIIAAKVSMRAIHQPCKAPFGRP